MKSFKEFLNEAKTDQLFNKFIKNNTPAGIRVDVKVNDNMYTVNWSLVEPQDEKHLKIVYQWIKNNVDVDDIDFEVDRVRGRASLFFVVDKLPAKLYSAKIIKESITSALRKIEIKNDDQLLKALFDIEANAKGRAKALAGEVAEYVEDNGLDRNAARMIRKLSSTLGDSFSQRRLVDAVEDYIEKVV